MTLSAWLVNSTIKTLSRMLCRVHDQALSRVPAQGPLILVSNHINFLDIPVLYTHLLPRPLTGFAKIETWQDPLLRPLANLWRGIPIRRGEPDLAALRAGLKALQEGYIVAIAPEGTRSGDGRLRRGHPGVAILAQMSGAPLLPMAFWGNEQFHANLRRLRRTDFWIAVGEKLRLKPLPEKTGRAVRQRITDEIMYQIAALLPPQYRGAYADLEQATMDYIEYA